MCVLFTNCKDFSILPHWSNRTALDLKFTFRYIALHRLTKFPAETHGFRFKRFFRLSWESMCANAFIRLFTLVYKLISVEYLTSRLTVWLSSRECLLSFTIRIGWNSKRLWALIQWQRTVYGLVVYSSEFRIGTEKHLTASRYFSMSNVSKGFKRIKRSLQ